MEEKRNNIIDLFCGAGGLSAGFSKAGYNIVTGVDKNKHSIDTFENNHECDPLLADINDRDIMQQIQSSIQNNGYTINEIDLVIGGPPCRSFSMANSQSDTSNHPLNELPEKFLDIVQKISPEMVLIENVPRILTASNGKFGDLIKNRLSSMGYNTTCSILKAEEFGVPQKRRRAFFLGDKSAEPELPDSDSVEFGFQLPVSVKQAISDLPQLPTGGGGEMKIEYDCFNESVSKYVEFMRNDAESGVIYNHRTTKNQKKTYRRFKHIPQGGNWKDIPEELMENYSNISQTHDHIYQRLVEEKPAKTVANFRKQMIVHPTQNRLLSVREAARLQSFPDSYHFSGDSFNARQQMVGDAVPVNLSYSIAKAIQNYSNVKKLTAD